MSSLERLIDELGHGVARELLLIGAQERPPLGTRRRVIASALSGTGATLTASAAASKPGTLLAAVAKWLTLGAVATGFPGAAETVASRTLATPIASVQVQTRRSTELAASKEALHESSPSASPSAESPKKVRGRRPPSGAVWIGATEVTVEARSLERVRVLAAADPKRALGLLDEHDLQFAQGGLRSEARALRERIISKLDPELPQ